MRRGCHCSTCGQLHQGVFDIAFAAPITWQGPINLVPNAAIFDAIASGGDALTEDFCILGEHRFLRCVLPFSIIGTEMTFGFGVWGSINPVYFGEVLDRFDDGTQDQIGPYFSWLSNILPDCDAGATEARRRCKEAEGVPTFISKTKSTPSSQNKGTA